MHTHPLTASALSIIINRTLVRGREGVGIDLMEGLHTEGRGQFQLEMCIAFFFWNNLCTRRPV